MNDMRKFFRVAGVIFVCLLVVAVTVTTYLYQYRNLRYSSGLLRIKLHSKNHPKMMVPVKINGADYTMMFDTGYPSSAISLPDRRQCIPNPSRTKSIRQDAYKRYKGIYSKQELDQISDICNVPEFYLGSVRIENAPFVRQENPFELATARMTKGVGVVGANYLRNGFVFFDLSTNVFLMTMSGPLSQPERNILGFDRDSVELPVVLDRDGNVTVPSQIETKDKKVTINNAVIDTGADNTLISESCYKKYFGVLPPHTSNYVTSMRGKSPARAWKADVILGSHRFKDLPIWIITDKGANHNFIIGMDILTKRRILIDYPARQMYIRKTTRAESQQLDTKLAQVLTQIR